MVESQEVELNSTFKSMFFCEFPLSTSFINLKSKKCTKSKMVEF